MFDVTLLSDTREDGIRKASFQTCDVVCSKQIDIELDGDIIKSVRYTGGCHGNTHGGGNEKGRCHRPPGGYQLQGQGHQLPGPTLPRP